MFFTCEDHFQLSRVLVFATPYFFHELEWEIVRVRKIQHSVPISMIHMDYLHKLCLY